MFDVKKKMMIKKYFSNKVISNNINLNPSPTKKKQLANQIAI